MGIEAIAVRRMRDTDAAAVTRIQSATAEASQWDPRGYLAFEAHVAEIDGAVAGFLVLRTTAPGEAEILNLAVAPEWRRRGVARFLLDTLVLNRADDVFLEVRASNAAARRLYETAGFTECGRRPGYYKNPPEAAVLMRRGGGA
jgi:ribosomal-protein-alanine acetyltransferase